MSSTGSLTPPSLSPDSAPSVSSLPTQDLYEHEERSLSMKISNSVGSFFRRSPSSTSDVNEEGSKQADQTVTTQSKRQATRSSGKSKHKDSKHRLSLAERLMRSLTGIGRGQSKYQEEKAAEEEEEVEEKEGRDDDDENQNKTSTPVFVSPDRQRLDVDLDQAPEMLSEEQKVLLRQSWALITAHVAQVGVETFMGLFHTHPEAIESFLAFKDYSTVRDIEQSVVLKAHALRVMQTVDKCVTRLDNLDKMSNVITALGRRHVDYRANIKIVPIIGQQFVSAIEPKLGDMWSPDVQCAWQGLFAVVNFHLQSGMAAEIRERNARSDGEGGGGARGGK
ncbi:uncharacterized protein LOC101845586 [Aplysia californica]|uniref:Globin n=1 Tax=Aplysia californica TaxID=6500 RepID=A0ABM0K7Z8_APLCA|nr:uncharacterized protein LOC101845586 [Aplysia californica]